MNYNYQLKRYKKVIHYKDIIIEQAQVMKSRLDKQQEKIWRIKDIQNNYQHWLENKANSYHIKLEKIWKNKESQIAKTVKRCKQRDKFVHQKLDDCKRTQKKSLNAAWKKAGELNQSILQYYKCRYNIKKPHKQSQLSKTLYMSISNPQDPFITQKRYLKTDPLGAKPSSKKNFSNTFNSGKLFQVQIPIKKVVKYSYSTPKNKNIIKSPMLQYQIPIYDNNQILQKLKQKQKINQNLRIQQLGQKFQKIQQTRVPFPLTQYRRKKKQQKKSDKSHQKVRHLTQFQLKKSPKKRHIKTQQDIINSDDKYKKQSRVKDRSLQAKLKRQEMFQQHLVEGQSYLQHVKIRHLKNLMTKCIAFNFIQKKLYQERLNN